MINNKLRLFVLFSGLTLGLNLKASAKINYQIKNDILKESQNLKDFFKKGFKIKGPESRQYQVKFFNEFPDNFKNFYEVYFWNDKKKSEAPLSEMSEEHIDGFFGLTVVPITVKINKVIGISINGKWDSDAISYFQDNLHKLLLANKTEFIKILGEKNSPQIESFWLFYFDFTKGHYLDDNYKEVMKGFPGGNEKMSLIIQQAYKKAKQNNKG